MVAGRVLGLDLTLELGQAQLVDQDLHACLVLVVPAPEAVVDAHDRRAVGEQLVGGQELAHGLADHRRPAKAAADQDLEADLALLVLLQDQADVVRAHGRTVGQRTRDRDLELARQVAELGVQGRPLAQQLGPGARVGDLVGGDAGIVVAGDVADAVARGLDGVHLDLGQLAQDRRDVPQLGPVELQVLPGREMAVAAVVLLRDVGELAQLPRAQGAVGDGDPQHVGVELQIEAVLQPQRLELVLAQLARQPALDLVGELRGPLQDELPVELVIAIHGDPHSSAPACPGRSAPTGRPCADTRAA